MMQFQLEVRMRWEVDSEWCEWNNLWGVGPDAFQAIPSIILERQGKTRKHQNNRFSAEARIVYRMKVYSFILT
jgi:hypothetical protein